MGNRYKKEKKTYDNNIRYHKIFKNKIISVEKTLISHKFLNSWEKHFYRNNYCLFMSFNNIIYFIYILYEKTIIAYDLENNKKVTEIKNAHEDFFGIRLLNHYQDKYNKKDLILSCSQLYAKLWDVYNWDCLCNYDVSGDEYFIKTSYLIFYKNEFCFFMRVYNFYSGGGDNPDEYEIFDLKEHTVIKRTRIERKDVIYYETIFYDEKLSKNYLITGHKGYIQSLDIDKIDWRKNWKKNCFLYYDRDFFGRHIKIMIRSNLKKIELIDLDDKGILRIWNFHSCTLLNRIKLYNKIA